MTKTSSSIPNRQVSATIRRELREAILGGRLHSGERLPSCRELSRQYGVAFGVANVALNELVAEGLIMKRHGAGAFVAEGFRPATRTVMIYAQYPQQPQFEHALSRYAEEHPHVRVQMVSNFVQADLLITGTSRAYQLWVDHHCLPLEGRLAASGLSEEDFWPGAIAAAQVGERLFALPFTWCPFVVVYHAGLTGTTHLADWTLDALRAWLRDGGTKLVGQGIRPLSQYRGFNSQVLPFLVRQGTQLVNEDGSRCLLHKRESLQAFRYCRDLVAPMQRMAPRTLCSIADLYEGRLAIRLGNAEAFVAAQRQGRPEIRLSPMPHHVGRESRLNGEWLTLNARGANTEGAWELLRWLVDDAQQQRLAQTGYIFPGRRFAIEQTIAHSSCPEILRQLLDFTYLHPHLRFDDLLFLDDCLDGWWSHDDLPALLAATADKMNVRLFTATASDEMILF